MQVDEFLTLFKKEMSPKEWENYIKTLIFDEKKSKQNILVFNAPNIYLAKYISSKYSKKMCDFYEKLTNNKIEIKINHEQLNKINTKSITTSQIKEQSSLLNESMTFDNFICGKSNLLAFELCKACINEKHFGKTYNPIFIHSPTGLGKTHLLQAVGNACMELEKKIVYKTANQFTIDFTDAVRNKTIDKFYKYYDGCDLLLVDDIQFFAKTEATQEAFFNMFETITSTGGQIILTSDMPPNLLKNIDKRLQTRFAKSAMADISVPELETKIAIIKKKCELNDLNLSNQVINHIATSLGDSIREIEGILTTIHGYNKILNQEIDINMIQKLLKDHVKEQNQNINIDDILEAVSKELNIKISDIKSNSKKKEIVLARRLSIALSKEFITNSMSALAKSFGFKDHTSISHNIKTIEKLLKDDGDFKMLVDELKTKILNSKQIM